MTIVLRLDPDKLGKFANEDERAAKIRELFSDMSEDMDSDLLHICAENGCANLMYNEQPIGTIQVLYPV